jgi:alanine-synthesizing transaminase
MGVGMRFSRRTSWNLEENELSAAVQQRRLSGRPLFDLTVSNPTQNGFSYHNAALLAPLSDHRAIDYEPDPLGMLSARQAVAAYYRDHGAAVSPERICLTTSTSEAYSFLFRLLCDPGDEILVARPSYPLFDFIAQLDNIKLREYPLWYDPHGDSSDSTGAAGWCIDITALEAAIGPRTRALIVVHPNYPTGSFVSPAEREALAQICTRHGLALIVDEVFLDYAINMSRASSFAAGELRCLAFVLSGLSKICALPQMKASWLVACGPPSAVQAAMHRIEVIADTFLSMNAPVQHALSTWLDGRHDIQRQIRERVISNLGILDERLRGTSSERFAIQGGWTALLRVPLSSVDFELASLNQGVLVQPGVFYGMPKSRVVLSLLTPANTWQRGLALLPLEE